MVFSGKVHAAPSDYSIHEQHKILGEAEFETIAISSHSFSVLSLTGRVFAGPESIACQSEPKDKGLQVVRSVVGPSNNLNNNAVYDRGGDWLLSLDFFYPRIHITPAKQYSYEIEAKGWEIIIRFRPHYYKAHRGLGYFEPKAYQIWNKPVVGWCSWYAYFDSVGEKDIMRVADVLATRLKPYGLDYLQLDDGYEQKPSGSPGSWLMPNQKFPNGLKSLASYISKKGMRPGIWTNVAFEDSAYVFAHRNLFLKDSIGNPVKGNWIHYIMDGTSESVREQLITPVYKSLADDGWQYFKLDALRHLKYEGYNAHQGYFRENKRGASEALRKLVQAVRNEIGRGRFLLSCWGIRPELVGITDGCRIGNDGFSYAGLAQFNSFNNIIWRNDPDHIVLSKKEAFRSCVATSLTGSVFMLTDKAEVYKNSQLIEAARRSIPVLFTQPGQVYDVDPSRSSHIAEADVELSGSGPRPFDASSSTVTGLFSLEINKPFGNWLVLARLDERDMVLSFRDLGLDEKKEFLVFEFWTKKFQGNFHGQFQPGPIDTAFGCQVFSIHENLHKPQILATNRHISCGAYDIGELLWENKKLSFKSTIIPGEPYIVYVFEDKNQKFKKLVCEDAQVAFEKKGAIRKITFSSFKRSEVHAVVEYW
ncbi:MAG: hypothetical protein NVS1B13_11100 [Flavisolibacter sp.]